MAGVALGTPIFTLMIALGDIFGLGGSSFISRLFGEKRFEDAKRISVFSFYGGIICGVVTAAVLGFFAPQMLLRLYRQAGTGACLFAYNTMRLYRRYFIMKKRKPNSFRRNINTVNRSITAQAAHIRSSLWEIEKTLDKIASKRMVSS